MTREQPKTIRDIAKACGVSSATVSRVFNGKANPELESTRKITQLLKQYKYMRQKKVKTSLRLLAVMRYGNIESSETAARLHETLYQVTHERNIYVTTHFALATADASADMEKLIAQHRADVVIAIGTSLRLNSLSFSKPLICLAQERFFDPGIFCIDSDDIVGFVAAMQLLISLGHKRIGFFCDYRYGERLHVQGTRAMLPLIYQSCGLPTDPQLIWRKDFPAGGHAPIIAEASDYFLNLPDPPTALIVLGDQYMSCFYSEFQARGLIVGRDISLVGHSGIAAGEMVSPPVTTIRKNYQQLASEAVNLALALQDNPNLPPKRIMIPAELIVRASTVKINT